MNKWVTSLADSVIARLVFLGFVAILGACNRTPPLAPELKLVKCPAGQEANARATFVKAKVTFLCISKELADAPFLLRCDRTSHPMICEDDGQLMFSHSVEGAIYAGLLPEELRRRDASSPGLQGGSRATFGFRKGPPRTTTFEEVETDWRFLLPDVKTLLPSGFTFVKGALCDRKATVLNSGVCNLEARSNSLYWHITVQIHADKGTPVTAEEYLEEYARYLKLLEMLVKDPG
jgi:hypothetical protein